MNYKDKWLDHMILKTNSSIYYNISRNPNNFIKTFMDDFKNTTLFTLKDKQNQKPIILNDKQEQIQISNQHFKIDTFKSFCDILIAFGYIEKQNKNSWKVLSTDLTTDQITKNLFTKHSDEHINILRQSRMIGLLTQLEIITKDNYDDFKIVGKRGKKASFDNIKEDQITFWEKNVSKSEQKTNEVLEMINKYEFIKTKENNQEIIRNKNQTDEEEFCDEIVNDIKDYFPIKKTNNFTVFKKTIRELLSEISNYNAMQIPLYQRNYSWKSEHVLALLNDLKNKVCRFQNDKDEHFFGFVAANIDKNNYYRIIDGQQRIMTSLIIIYFIQSQLNINNNENPIKILFPNLNIDYEIDTDDNIYNDVKILLNSNTTEDIEFSQKNIRDAYNTINKFFEVNKIKKKDTYKKFLNIFLDSFVFCLLEYKTKPKKEMTIFENLNSKGKPLSDLDLIKNFLISHDTENYETKDKLNKFQDKIINFLKEQLDEKNNVATEQYIEDFLYHYLRFRWCEKFKTKENYSDFLFAKFSKSTQRYSLFKYFKDYVLNYRKTQIIDKTTYIDFIQELNSFLKLYIELKFPKIFKDIGSNEWLIAIRNKDIHFPLVFYLYDKYYQFNSTKWENKTKDSEITVIKYIKVFSSHIIKVISVHKDSRLSLFDLTHEFINMIKESKEPEEIKKELKNNSTHKGVIFNTPSKEQFLDSCKNEILALWISYSLVYIIQISLEKQQKFYDNIIGNRIIPSVEHIMPQNLDNNWKEVLIDNINITKENVSEKHKFYLNQIGNLVYVNSDLNSSLGKRVFKEKKIDYKNSKWRIISGNNLGELQDEYVKPICEYENWNFEIIKKRTEKFAEYVYNIMEDLDNV
ncbi:DUF262 domain-containing protein [Mycoplasma capricolum]|uniref:DUF262 domain-containing protein n=1 Tax=Mycoplasma capricolum TaxID=2095 RepID=UPI003DA341DF